MHKPLTISASSSTSSSSTSQSMDDMEYVDDPDHDHVVVLYGSETGNSQDFAERVGREIRRVGRRCIVLSMDVFDVMDLPHIPLLILIVSTHGRGDPPPTMQPLWNALLRTSLPHDILEDVHFALYGMGDSGYERFCYAGKMLLRRLEGLGAKQMGEPAWGDERAPDGPEETFLPWFKQTLDLMLPLLPPPPLDFEPASSSTLPPPIFTLEPEPSIPDLSTLSLSLQLNGKIGKGAGTIPPDMTNGDSLHRRTPPIPKDRTWARITKNNRVTKAGWWQDTREVELELDDPHFPGYLPASTCHIQPALSREEVDEFLELNNLGEIADDPFIIRSSIPDQPIPSHLPETCTDLRILLTYHLDIRCSPRKSFFEWLLRLSSDEREVERLEEFVTDPDEIHNYATRPSRSILETLADFRHTKIPLSHILEILPPLRRRQFSIASSWQSHPGKIQLLVGLVEYKTNLKIPRKGLCSSWLDQISIGTRVPVKVHSPTLFLPSNPNTPVILVGPGTGVAPMRAFVEERIRQGAGGSTILYFGCRSSKADLYYESEWDQYKTSDGLKVRIAASRDQVEKFYVQDLIRRDGKIIKEWVVDRGGFIYISGSSKIMPKEVRAAVAWCISNEGEGNMTMDQAEKYVEAMFDGDRGGEESW